MSEFRSDGAQVRRPSGPETAVIRFGLLAVVVIAVAAYFFVAQSRARSSATRKSDPAAVPVIVGAATTRDLPVALTGIGTVLPLSVVDVKARIDGQLDRVAFTEGQEVHAGDLLAQIDPRPFQAALAQAEANRAKDEAQLANARLDNTRMAKLAGTGVIPMQAVDTAAAQVRTLEATVRADQAAVETARLQLGFTRLQSPIDGRVGLRLVNPGSIVHVSDATGIVTVTQMHPIAVLFALPQDELPDILAGSAKGKLPVVAYTRDGARVLAEGELFVVDSQVDTTNGQVRLKATFTNSDRALWPGALVSARLLVRTAHGVTVVPARAVMRGQIGEYVYVLKSDKTVEVRQVTTGQTADGFTALRTGVSPGEIVVFDGQARLAPGSKVDPKQEPAKSQLAHQETRS